MDGSQSVNISVALISDQTVLMFTDHSQIVRLYIISLSQLWHTDNLVPTSTVSVYVACDIVY